MLNLDINYFLKPFEFGLNKIINLDPDFKQELAKLNNKIIKLKFGKNTTLGYLNFQDHKIKLTASSSNYDLEISGSLTALTQILINGEDLMKIVRNKQINLAGDLELAESLQKILKTYHLEWKNISSKFLGADLGYLINTGLQTINTECDKLTGDFRNNLREYLQDEISQLPSVFEVQDFLKSVDELRMQFDRLEARVKYLNHNK